MKFVFFGYDFMIPTVQRLLNDGHELLGIISFECDNIFNFNLECQKLATQKNIPLILSPARDIHIDSFLDKGADCFFAAGYPYKIPPVPEESHAYGINLHPTALPKARGLMPVPHIIMNHDQEAAGLTLHKLAPKFDQGDILQQTSIPLSSRETVETYSAKIALRAPDFISRAFADLPDLWVKAKPQKEEDATCLKPPTHEMRIMDWSKKVCDIDSVGRAFGRFGALAEFDKVVHVLYHYDFWEESHSYTPGTIAARLSREIVIAASDGFVCLKDFQPLNNG